MDWRLILVVIVIALIAIALAKRSKWKKEARANVAHHKILAALSREGMNIEQLHRLLVGRYTKDELNVYLTQLRAHGLVEWIEAVLSPVVQPRKHRITEKGRQKLLDLALGNGGTS